MSETHTEAPTLESQIADLQAKVAALETAHANLLAELAKRFPARMADLVKHG